MENGKGFGLCVLLVCLLFVCSAFAIGSEIEAVSFKLWKSSRTPVCGGVLGECFENEEMQLDSEIYRRILATRRYIGYDALRSNTVPCSKRGASYYNCRSGAQANPYRRTCSRISRCARDTS